MTTYQVRFVDLSDGKFYDMQLGPITMSTLEQSEKRGRVQILQCEKVGAVK